MLQTPCSPTSHSVPGMKCGPCVLRMGSDCIRRFVASGDLTGRSRSHERDNQTERGSRPNPSQTSGWARSSPSAVVPPDPAEGVGRRGSRTPSPPDPRRRRAGGSLELPSSCPKFRAPVQCPTASVSEHRLCLRRLNNRTWHSLTHPHSSGREFARRVRSTKVGPVGGARRGFGPRTSRPGPTGAVLLLNHSFAIPRGRVRVSLEGRTPRRLDLVVDRRHRRADRDADRVE